MHEDTALQYGTICCKGAVKKKRELSMVLAGVEEEGAGDMRIFFFPFHCFIVFSIYILRLHKLIVHYVLPKGFFLPQLFLLLNFTVYTWDILYVKFLQYSCAGILLSMRPFICSWCLLCFFNMQV